ncbi:hypothetical protein SAMN05216345_11723 [Cupriavidus sp. YR651]|uniref:hypothetical protein n=1 Tax=Cupriavidus sp. YR651 TaxID=1855315 RepID=UPI000890D00E|nr:hypothetical protein [Cupriavidus sp. YR651]SDD81669.1 hypothetical protein SAMN05216345_11723 [Cupriavidus sp. YR651]
MSTNTLTRAMAAVREAWGPLTTDLVETCRLQIESLANASPDESWLGDLHRDQPASRELYRDPTHGFVLMAHFEHASLYRPPHDHGRSWVIYAVQRGESEMGTYGRIETPGGETRLVKRSATLVKPGQAQVYLPGDIHDTLCVSGPALLFRFTERDLKWEDAIEKKVTRYVQHNGFWSVP